MPQSDRDAFLQRCTRVAELARSAGMTFAKTPGAHALTIEGHGKSNNFPIVTDERDWRQTTDDEALYAVLLDAHSWASTHVDESALEKDNPIERTQISIITRDFTDEVARAKSLAELSGGQAQLESLWEAAGFDPAAARRNLG